MTSTKMATYERYNERRKIGYALLVYLPFEHKKVNPVAKVYLAKKDQTSIEQK